MININEAHDLGKLYGLITDLRSKRLNNNIELNPNRLVDLRENIDAVAQGLDLEEIVYYTDESLGEDLLVLTKEDEQNRREAIKQEIENEYLDVINAVRIYYRTGDTQQIIENLYNIYEQEISL
jgi:hypothetical protein